MDKVLLNMMSGGQTKKDDAELRVMDIHGNVEIMAATGPEKYAIKPLKELYGPGVNALSIVPDSAEYMPLFLGIEQKIVAYWALEPELTDGQVSLALDKLAINPEAEVGVAGLIPHVQLALRLALSVNDYSRKDVQRALRRISKSVSLHTKQGGRQGYLTFVRSFIG